MNQSQPVFNLRCPIESSFLDSVSYCPLTCILELEFHNGARYRYFGVPVHVCYNLLCAASKGRFFNRYVRGAFAYQRVRPARHSVGLNRCPRPHPAEPRRYANRRLATSPINPFQEAGA